MEINLFERRRYIADIFERYWDDNRYASFEEMQEHDRFLIEMNGFDIYLGNRQDQSGISEKCVDLLNLLGYSKEFSAERIKVFNNISESMTKTFQALSQYTFIKKILVGSKREGISLLRESDTDLMFIFENILCVDNELELGTCSDKLIFYLDTHDSPPGYAYLRLGSHQTQKNFIEDSYVTRGNKTFLSSTKFLTQNGKCMQTKTGWVRNAAVYLQRRGPSLPETLRTADWYDTCLEWLFGVQTFKCAKDCTPALTYKPDACLLEWTSRERRFNWPTKSMIDHAASLPVFVVPVGEKGTKDADMQWRISYILTEIYLVQQFTDMQIKILVMLKWLAENCLKPIYQEMTSYVMKNLAFWLSENVDIEKKTLLDNLDTSLTWLRSCVIEGHMPCYMLPERNLLVDMDGETRKLLIWKLRSILKNEVVEACKVFLWARRSEPQNNECLSNSDISHYMAFTINKLSSIAIGCNRCSTALGAHFYLLKQYMKMHKRKHSWISLLKNAQKLIRLAEPKNEVILQAESIIEDKEYHDKTVTFPSVKKYK